MNITLRLNSQGHQELVQLNDLNNSSFKSSEQRVVTIQVNFPSYAVTLSYVCSFHPKH